MAHNARMLQDVEVAGIEPLPTLLPARPVTPKAQAQVSADAPKPGLKIAVHDRSRVEWVATVPIAAPGIEHTWEITFDLQVPDAIFLPHRPWDHFTVHSRLMSPLLSPGRHQEGAPIEQLRRRALAAAHATKQATAALVREVYGLRRKDRVLSELEAARLESQLQHIVEDAAESRAALTYLRDARDQALELEHGLADEFVSNQLLMMVVRLTRALAPRRTRAGGVEPAMLGAVASLHQALRAALQDETAHRRAAGMHFADMPDERSIEGYVQRGALLKKHFQQALFLDARAYMIDQRLHNWIAAGMAMVAFVIMFAGQVWLMNSAMTAMTTLSLLFAGSVGALVYAAKDRIKEVGRDWVARRVKDSYADRVAHLSLQARMDPNCSDFALARETISIQRNLHCDPLNAALGTTSVVHRLVIRERLKHKGLPILQQQGLLGLKHVFRYDLSPFFARMDDLLKLVPVIGAERVLIKTATRVYTLPVEVCLAQLGGEARIVQKGYLRLRRSGLERFVPNHDAPATIDVAPPHA